MPSKSEIRDLLKKGIFERKESWRAEEVHQVVQSLQELFGEKEALLQEKVLQAFREFPFPQVEVFLLKFLPDQNWTYSCLRVLEKIGTQKSLPFLKTYFRSSSFLLKWSALEASQEICQRMGLTFPSECFSEQARLLLSKNFASIPASSLVSCSMKHQEVGVLEMEALSEAVVFEQEIATWNCPTHPSLEAEFFCVGCGIFLCKSCGVWMKKEIYCEYCSWRGTFASITKLFS